MKCDSSILLIIFFYCGLLKGEPIDRSAPLQSDRGWPRKLSVNAISKSHSEHQEGALSYDVSGFLTLSSYSVREGQWAKRAPFILALI